MARYTRNAVEGKADESRSGWRSRREKARKKRSGLEMTRAEIAAARRAHAGAAQADSEVGFNPGVAAGGDYVANLTDEDLAAYHHQLIGKKPHHKLKRPAIEKAVREAEAARAGAPEPEEPDCDEQGEEELIEDDQQ